MELISKLTYFVCFFGAAAVLFAPVAWGIYKFMEVFE